MASRYSVDQSASLAGFTRGSVFCTAASPRTSQPASSSIATSGFRCVPAAARSTSRVSAAPQTPVRRILAFSTMLFAMSSDGGLVDIDVADAFEMREHRHARLLLHARDQALAAARHDDVDAAVEAFEHHADGGAVARRHQRDRVLGQVGFAQALGERGMDGARRAVAVGAAAQDHGVAGLQRQRAGVGGDVGPAFVDDADDAERHAHALDGHAVRARPGFGDLADRIGQLADDVEALGHRFDALVVRAPAGRGTSRSGPRPCRPSCRRHWPKGFRTCRRGSRRPCRRARGSSARTGQAPAPAPPPLRRGRSSFIVAAMSEGVSTVFSEAAMTGLVMLDMMIS